MCKLILIYIPMSFVPLSYPDPLYQTLENKITKTDEKVKKLGQELKTLTIDAKSGELNRDHSR